MALRIKYRACYYSYRTTGGALLKDLLLLFLIIHTYVSVWICVHECRGPQRQKRVLDPLVSELHTAA